MATHYKTFSTPLPLVTLGKNSKVTFKVYKNSTDTSSLTAEDPNQVRYLSVCSNTNNTYTVKIHFVSENVKHQCTCSDEQQGWLNAYFGAYALANEGFETNTIESWVSELEIQNPIENSAWIIQHLNSSNSVLKDLATRAHKKLLALEDSCTESKKKSKR